jgi:hypothetical protein
MTRVWWSLLIAALCVTQSIAQSAPPLAPLQSGEGDIERTAAWPWQHGRRSPIRLAPSVPDTPHPAVARIIVPEDGATAYGSGTLIDVREQFGLVITNWHVVRDSTGTVEVVFPNGFRSQARPLKVDADWDLAALVVWRPPIEPVRVSQVPPRPGDVLTIHGYGQGRYRIATGRCTAFYAPKVHLPQEMVELDVEARQGDSGGPIFNQRGEMAGVLFGAGEGTTIGSFAPRVESFLATLAPDIGLANDQAQLAVADRPAPDVHPLETNAANYGTANRIAANENRSAGGEGTNGNWPSSEWSPVTIGNPTPRPPIDTASNPPALATETPVSWSELAENRWYDVLKSTLAVVGLATITLQLVRMVK